MNNNSCLLIIGITLLLHMVSYFAQAADVEMELLASLAAAPHEPEHARRATLEPSRCARSGATRQTARLENRILRPSQTYNSVGRRCPDWANLPSKQPCAVARRIPFCSSQERPSQSPKSISAKDELTTIGTLQSAAKTSAKARPLIFAISKNIATN